MSKPRPWWTTYPKELWSAEDRRAARKAGVVVPPLPQPDVDPAVRPLAEQAGPKEIPMSLHGDPGRSEAARRRLAERADRALAAWGIRSRR
jgi:hypothetical protein